MARRKLASDADISSLVRDFRDARASKSLLKYAESVHSDPTHLLYSSLNKYPGLPFEITKDDLRHFEPLLAFPEPVRVHKWTPWEKIFYAALWKDAKLKPLQQIIRGVGDALKNVQDLPETAIVYRFFGRHLTDRLNEPIIDQHSIRAQRLILNEDSIQMRGIRQSGLPTGQQAAEFCFWFKQILKEEGITNYTDSRRIDSILYALGAFAKCTE